MKTDLSTQLRHGDFIITKDHVFFLVWGDFTINNRYFGAFKYYPDPSGDRKYDSLVLKKVPPPIRNFLESVKLMEHINPDYVIFSKFFGRRIVAIPKNEIKESLYASKRLTEITNKPQTGLEADLAKLTEYLRQIGIKHESFGVTASLLSKTYSNTSDIDFIVYCSPNELRENEKVLMHNIGKVLTSKHGLGTTTPFYAKMFGVKEEDVFSLLAKTGRYVEIETFNGRKVSMMFKSTTIYGGLTDLDEREIISHSRVTLKGVVIDDTWAGFRPSWFVVDVPDTGLVKVCCLHKGGGLVRKGDELELTGNLVKYKNTLFLSQLVIQEDLLKITSSWK